MPKVSLIVPFYNVEKWIGECLDSLSNQTLSDIEIVCVDDCSPDGSRAIVQQYMNKDPRIKLITHTENKRQGGARNTGVQHATGEYIWFIDSDDLIPLDACEVLYNKAKQHDATAVKFGYLAFLDGTSALTHSIAWSEKPQLELLSKNNLYSPLIVENNAIEFSTLNVSACNVLWKTTVYKNSGFAFVESVLFEDVFTPLALIKQPTVLYLPYVGYYYRKRQNSTTTSENSHSRPYYLSMEKQLLNFMPKMLQTMGVPIDAQQDLAIRKYVASALSNRWALETFLTSPPNINNLNLQSIKRIIDAGVVDAADFKGFIGGEIFLYCFFIPIKSGKAIKLFIYHWWYNIKIKYHGGGIKHRIIKKIIRLPIFFLGKKVKKLFK
jgi:glycosyltransferase involved in cell wall biosynthesis